MGASSSAIARVLLVGAVLGMSVLVGAGSATHLIVCVDPGHGGGDSGSGANSSCAEKDMNLNVGTKFWDDLTDDYAYAASVMTRYIDINPTKTQRINTAVQNQAVALISVHHNYSPNPSVNHCLALYCLQSQQAPVWTFSESFGDLLSDQIHYYFLNAYGGTDNGVHEDCTVSPLCHLWIQNSPIGPTVIGEGAFVLSQAGYDLCDDVYAIGAEAFGYVTSTQQYFSVISIGTSFNAQQDPGCPTDILLTWHESDPPTWPHTYDLYRADNCNGPYQLLQSVDRFDPCCSQDSVDFYYQDHITPTAYQRPYYYRLIVSDTGERVEDSATPSSFLPSPPGVPGNLAAVGDYQGGATGTADLTWDSSAGTVTGYHIYRRLAIDDFSCVNNNVTEYRGSSSTTSFHDTGVQLNANVYYRVTAYNSTGPSAESGSASVLVVTGAETPTDEAGRSLAVRVVEQYRGRVLFEVELPEAGPASLDVFDIHGRRVATPLAGAFEAGRRRVTWDGKSKDGDRVASSVYFAQVTGAAGASKGIKVTIVR